uniref:hypothetical protein n=1 Tax=Prevotella sp. TaxID=59823 RepID=UPI0040297886
NSEGNNNHPPYKYTRIPSHKEKKWQITSTFLSKIYSSYFIIELFVYYNITLDKVVIPFSSPEWHLPVRIRFKEHK